MGIVGTQVKIHSRFIDERGQGISRLAPMLVDPFDSASQKLALRHDRGHEASLLGIKEYTRPGRVATCPAIG
jgi:hypothetical protein